MSKSSKIRFFVMDVDGTLTDGKIYMGQNGEVMKAFNIKDGFGIKSLMYHGIVPAILTARESKIVQERAKELGIKEVHQSVTDKLSKLNEIADNLEMVAYIGDDIPDLEIMKAIKIAGGSLGCPKDAASEIREIADFISSVNGGEGCVREYIEWLIKSL